MGGIKYIANVLNQKGAPAIFEDTFANRPTAGYTGRLFISTDTLVIQRDNGVTWDSLGNPGVMGTGAPFQVAFWTTPTGTLTGSNNFFWDGTNNRLGLGTNAPGVRLDIHSTNVIAQFNGTGTNNAYLDFQNAGSTQWRIGNFYNGAVNQFAIFNAGGSTNTLSILQSGFVGINIATPLYQLDIRTTNSVSQNNYFQSTTSLSNLWTDSTPGIELLNNIANSGSIGAGCGIKFNLSSSLNPQAGIFGIRESTTASSLAFYTQASNTSVLQKVGITGSGSVNIGGSFSSTNNILQVTGNVAIGTTTAAPTNGLLVSGNMGVGSSISSAKFTVNTGTNENTVVTTAGAGDMRISALNDAASTTVQLSVQANPLYFRGTGGTIVGSITGGNVGFGYTTSNLNLAVAGSVYQGTNTANALYEVFCNGNLYTGGLSPTILTVSGNTTMVRTVTGYRCTATLTLTLPAVSGLNNMYYVIANTGATITVQRAGTDTILDKTGTSVTSVTVLPGTRSMFYVGGGTETFQIF